MKLLCNLLAVILAICFRLAVEDDEPAEDRAGQPAQHHTTQGGKIFTKAGVLSPTYFWEVTQTCMFMKKNLLIQENLIKICVGDF